MPRHHRRRKRSNLFIAIVLLLIAAVAGTATFALTNFAGEDSLLIQDGGKADGRLRVLLRSLGAPEELTLTLDGVYSLESDPGFRFARGSVLKVVASEGTLLLDCGGMTIDMGPNFTLTRHSAPEGEPNGIYIAQSEKPNMYNGDLYFEAKKNAVSVLLYIDIEEYLYGVVPYEMSDSWPIEALKAQAIAARTYALGRKSARTAYDYDLVDTTADQVFKGYCADWVNAIEAVDSTRGIVGMYKGSFATCYYGASNGGQTAMPQEIWGREGDYAYLDVRDDPYDLENPKSVVRTLDIPVDGAMLDETMTRLLKASLSELLAGMGYSEDAEDIRIVSVVSVTTCEPKGLSGSKMAQTLRFSLKVEGRKWLTTSDSQEPVLGLFEEIETPLEADISLYTQIKAEYADMNINSADCELYTVAAVYADGSESSAEEISAEKEIVSFRLEGRRYGHGVGMSQRGAQTMAGDHGMLYSDIMLFYYPHMDLVRYEIPETELTQLDELPRGLGAARVIEIVPKPTPAPLPSLEKGEKYGYVVLNNDASALNVRAEPNTSCEIISTLDEAQRVIICETLDGWYRIRTAEVPSGYVSAKYLMEE